MKTCLDISEKLLTGACKKSNQTKKTIFDMRHPSSLISYACIFNYIYGKLTGHWYFYIIWAATRETLSLGFLTKEDSNQSAQLQRLVRILKSDYKTFQKVDNKTFQIGADQTEQLFCLASAFIVRMQQSQGFSPRH